MADLTSFRVPYGPWPQLAGPTRGKLEDFQGREAGQYGERASMSVVHRSSYLVTSDVPARRFGLPDELRAPASKIRKRILSPILRTD